MTKIIEIKDLHFAYEKEETLHNVSLCIEKGEFVTFIGANGSGKSTLMKLILGFLKPQHGEIKIKNKNGEQCMSENTFGYVPQGGILNVSNFPATVKEVILLRCKGRTLFGFYSKRHLERVEEVLDKVGLSHKIDSQISKLSGGQLQKVLIAREIINQPDILFLDEPTNGLDQQSTLDLYNLLKELNEKEGITVILVTHDFQYLDLPVDKKVLFKNRTIEVQNV